MSDDRVKLVSGLLGFLSGSNEEVKPKEEVPKEVQVEQTPSGVTLDEVKALLESQKEDPKVTPEPSEEPENGDVVDYKGKFEEYQDQLVLSKVESGFHASGVEVPRFEDLKGFLKLDKLKDSEGNLSDENIDKFVTLITGIATKTPPKSGKRRTATKAGLGRYLEEDN